MNKNTKALVYAIMLLIFAVIVGSALKPVYLDWYFEQQESISIAEAGSIRDSMDPARMQYGKVFLVNGIVGDVWADGSFVITDEYDPVYKMAAGRNLAVHKTDKTNCMPHQGKQATVAGAFNPGRNGAIYFYGVWVVGGCE